MRYLSAAFAGEGATDYRFLSDLVSRHLETVLARRARDVVEIGPVSPVLPGGRPSNQSADVVREFTEGRICADLLFVHTDAGSSVDDALITRVHPVAQALARLPVAPIVVGVVPDRETESWMVVDVAAWERIMGLRKGFLKSVSKPSEIHRCPDPNGALNELVASVDKARSASARRRRSQRVGRSYATLAREVSFEVLEQVAAFRRYRRSLEYALQELEYIE